MRSMEVPPVRTMTLLLAVALFTASVGLPRAASATVHVELDRLTGATRVRVAPSGFLAYRCTRPSLVWLAVIDDKTRGLADPQTTLSFQAFCSEWVYLKSHVVVAVRDGRPFPLPEAVHTGELGNDNVSEKVSLVLPLSAVRDLASSSVLEFHVGPSEVKLSKKELQDIREFADAVAAAVGAAKH
jgi:hypothetical protein